MKKIGLALSLLVAGVLALALPTTAEEPDPVADAPAIVVGTFDSRGVLMAWVRSDAFREYVSALKEDVDGAIERAREAGDRALVADLEALGPTMQERVHRQGFGTAPVDEILTRIADRLPAVAEKAGVDVIVSKWALTWRSPDATFVDVTDLLVAEFDPDEETLDAIRQILATEPVPFEKLGKHD